MGDTLRSVWIERKPTRRLLLKHRELREAHILPKIQPQWCDFTTRANIHSKPDFGLKLYVSVDPDLLLLENR